MWSLIDINITFPTINSYNNFAPYYSITSLTFQYKNYVLVFDFCVSRKISLYDNNKTNIADGIYETGEIEENIKNLKKCLKQNNLSEFKIITIDEPNIKFMIYENDEDGNYNDLENIHSTTCGDYGVPVKYESKYKISEYDYMDKAEQKKLELMILNDIKTNLKTYIKYNKKK